MSRRRIFTFKNKRHIPRFLLWTVAALLRIYAATFRIRVIDENGVLNGGKWLPAIFAIWHNRILFLPCVAPLSMRRSCTVLISKSRDGEYVTGLAREFGVEPVRGSSSKGGVHALLELGNSIVNGISPIITLDGPRGPRYAPHPGAAMLAMMHGVPIVPMSINASSYWQLKSWDRMQIPRPFAKIEFRLGMPLEIPQGTGRERAAELLQAAMMAITDDK